MIASWSSGCVIQQEPVSRNIERLGMQLSVKEMFPGFWFYSIGRIVEGACLEIIIYNSIYCIISIYPDIDFLFYFETLIRYSLVQLVNKIMDLIVIISTANFVLCSQNKSLEQIMLKQTLEVTMNRIQMIQNQLPMDGRVTCAGQIYNVSIYLERNIYFIYNRLKIVL